MGHYDTLGVPRDADPEAIKRAYRRRAREEHPDQGGDDERMAEVNKAYAVLADPETRKRYDETGSDNPVRTPEEDAREVLLQVFAGSLEAEGDWLFGVRHRMQHGTSELARHRREATAKRARLEKRRERIRTKAGAENLAHMVIDQQLAVVQQQIAALDRAETVHATALRLLDAYEADPEPAQPPAWQSNPYITGTATFVR